MKGFVYAICEGEEIVYVGSTRQRLFCMRKGDHTKPNKSSKQNIHRYVEEKGGWEGFTFKILEEVECETIKELLTRELYYFELHKPKFNINRPLTDRETRNAQKRITGKAFRDKNPNYHKRYEEHRKKRDKIRSATIINCECGKQYTAQNKSNHCKTKYHQDSLVSASGASN